MARVRRQDSKGPEPAVPDQVQIIDNTANNTDKSVSKTENNDGDTDSGEGADDKTGETDADQGEASDDNTGGDGETNESTEILASVTPPVNFESSATVAGATTCLLATLFSL